MSIDSLAYPGSNVTYEIVISNFGTGTLYNITLNDTLPAVPGNWTYVNNSIVNLTSSICNVTYNGTHFRVNGSLDPGKVCRFRYDAQTPELTCLGEYYNFITGYAYDISGAQFDASARDSTDVVPDVILDVSKNVNVSSNNGSLVYRYGSVIEFIINVSSRGNTTVYNVTLNDTLAPGLEFVNCTNASGSIVNVSTAGSATVGQSINFSAGNITGKSYKLFYIRANVTNAAFDGPNINEITVSGGGPCGPVVTDFDVASFAIGVPKLEVYKRGLNRAGRADDVPRPGKKYRNRNGIQR
jgi:uncharacterized repeat protein (TIGR01451 family)